MTRKLLSLLLTFAIIAAAIALPGQPAASAAAPLEEWVARYDTPFHRDDYAFALALDASGNVYVTGTSCFQSTWGACDYVTVKHRPDGSLAWMARYDGPGKYFDVAQAVAVDGSGNVYVAGDSTGSNNGYDIATVKYGPDGSQAWVARYDGPANSGAVASALAVDGSGNVYVTGSSTGSGTGGDSVTIKYGPDGSQEWVARYDGPASGDDAGGGLAVDGSGNVYVTGRSAGSGTGRDSVTIKYRPDGSEDWVARYDGPAGGDDGTGDLALDGSGNVYVTGNSAGSGTGEDYVTIKYRPDGSEEWVARYDGPISGDDAGYRLAVDGSGNVYVTGDSTGSATEYDYDYATIKYRPDGSQEWVARYGGPANSFDGVAGLALDGSGNVYVTGRSPGFGTSNDYVTIKYLPDGTEDWLARYDGPVSGSDDAAAVAVDESGNAYVTGYSEGPRAENGTNDDYATIKYARDGDGDGMPDLWEQQYPCLDPAAPDSAGDPDADGLTSLAEYHRGTNPCVDDTDADGVADSTDNCPLVSNPGQENFDGEGPPVGNGAGIGNGSSIPGDDATVPNSDNLGDACDPDDDNDGIPDMSDPDPRGDITYDDNGNGNPCVSLGTDAADDGPSWDSNCDGWLDGGRGASSWPDSDGDGLLDLWEARKWGTDPTKVDTDGDGIGDCTEAVDTDGNGIVDFGGDVLNSARATLLPAGTGPGQFGKDGDFDIDGNGAIEFGSDTLRVARFALKLASCK